MISVINVNFIKEKKTKEYFIKKIITSKYFAHKYCSLIYKGRLCEYHEHRKHEMYMLKKEENTLNITIPFTL